MSQQSNGLRKTARNFNCSARSHHRVAVTFSAFALLAAAHDPAGAQDATGGANIKLPDVTVEQAPAQPAPKKTAQKTKTRAKAKAVATRAPKQAPAPAAASSASAVPAVAQAAGRNLGPATGTPGTPSASIGAVNGASGAGAQTATGVDMTKFEATPVFSVNDIIHDVPGVSLKQGNGPRDMGISIRGSNARNGFGIRNIVILDDGFPVTQPDGLSRSDLIDPHAYAGTDVWRGPSSALFGNYATGGAINFRTWPGGTIDGVEYGIDVGSFNYLNNYAIAGTKGPGYEGSIFLSDVRGDGYFGYSAFDTQTINALLTYSPTANDTVTLKAINNTLDTELPFRLSLNQFKQNPFQKGCETAAGAAAGCATNNFLGVPQTAEQAGVNRDDRRTIGGVRWDHAFNEATSGEVQVVIDDRNINQPTGPTSAIGDYLSYNVSTGLTNHATVAGLPAISYFGAFWNYLPVDGLSYNVAPGGDARLGPLKSQQTGSTMNFGARAREEVQVSRDVSVIAGATVERTSLEGFQRSFTYDQNGALLNETDVSAERDMTNVAPELGVLYRPNGAWQLRARVGTGYGTPQFSNLFVTSAGQPGNNTELKSQRNVGTDIGADWTPVKGVMVSVTGFYEFFRNELVSQSAGPGLLSYTFNAPASEHRGIEAAADIALGEGYRFTAAYLFNDQIYTDYEERLSGSTMLFDRAGNKIPGVSPNELTARLSYDVPDGNWKGIGAYAEYQWHDGFYMENANLLKTPAYDVVDVNVHYERALSAGPIRSFLAYFEVRNVFDETYVAAANNITDSIGATPSSLADVSGSIYAGAPRTYYGGMKVRF